MVLDGVGISLSPTWLFKDTLEGCAVGLYTGEFAYSFGHAGGSQAVGAHQGV